LESDQKLNLSIQPTLNEACFLETEISGLPISRVANDDMVEELNLEEVGTFDDSAG